MFCECECECFVHIAILKYKANYLSVCLCTCTCVLARVCVCICVRLSVYVCTCACLYVHVCVHLCAFACVHLYVRTSICLCTCASVCASLWVCAFYVRVCAFLRACVFVRVLVCVRVFVCVRAPGDYERYTLEGTEETLGVARAFKHPSYYNGHMVDHDIALLRLERPAQLSTWIVPACLPPRPMAERVLHLNGTVTVVTGWGKEHQDDPGETTVVFSSALNVIQVPLVERAECQSHMDFNVSENMLCAGVLGSPMDACEGDSGGPMVTLYRDTWFLLGLVSWGEGCGRLNKLGVYTKVANYNEWINAVRQDWDRTHGRRG